MTLRQELPRYNQALGPSEDTLVVSPPFTFPGVTARVFPLRANMNILSAFCNRYLNVAPEVCSLHPYFPYVLLVVLDYGRMAIEEFNLGWVSQHEVFFAVPLGMWRRDGQGRRTFQQWMLNTPFIVVDNATSLTTGRETYGWPKILGQLQYNPERWLIDPRNPIRFLTLNVLGPGCDGPSTRLIEIEQHLGQNASLAPLDFALINPFERLSRLSHASWSIGSDLAQLLLGAPLSGFTPGYSGDRLEVFVDSLRQLFGFYGNPGVNVVTLKQFRDSLDPTLACYQALVGSRLSVARFNCGGLLGLYNLLQSDITGGFSIRLYDNPAFPIVESLGLEVAYERTVNGNMVSFLQPFFPFWLSVDLNYGRGETICWRARGGPWFVKKKQVSLAPLKKEALYNTVAGGAEQVWYGPYLVPDAGFAIFVLKANPDRLAAFLEDYLNDEDLLELKLASDQDGVLSIVYMIISENRVFTNSQSGTWIQARQATFYVPLQWKLKRSREAFKQALVTPFAFVDNPSLAMTMREVEGVPAINASIATPARLLQPAGPLLTLHVDVFTALGAGLGSEQRTLLEVYPGELNENPAVDYRLAMPLLSQRLMLKQFRDVEEPDRACYKALVLESWEMPQNPAPKPFQHKVEVRLHRYPSIPLAETLGLEIDRTLEPSQPGEAMTDILMLEAAFKVRMGLKIGLGQLISYTAGYLPWRPPAASKPGIPRS